MYENKNSHEYARALQQAAEFLLSKPEFTTETSGPYIYLGIFYDKEPFLKATRSLGALTKEYTTTQLKVKRELPLGARVYFEIGRDKVCRLVQEAKWECEPILSPEEDASVGAA